MVKQWVLPGVAALILAVMFLIANSTPLESWYTFQKMLEKVLIVLLGIIYTGAAILPYVLGAAVVAVAGFLLVYLLQVLVWNRRWPTLIPLLIVLGVNCIVFSAPGLLFSPNVGSPLSDCELYFDSQNGVKVIRYPMDIRTDYGEQSFFMVTHDGGATWQQLAQAFAYDPAMLGCQNIEERDDMITLIIEQSDVPGELSFIEYMSEDGGETWQRR